MSRDLNEIITLDGVKYVRSDSVLERAKPGRRAVVVIDRGWIVAGDVVEVDGRLKISRAVHVRSWSSIGFDGMIENPKSSNVKLFPFKNGFDVPADAELFRVPVGDNWGL
jgi:hypothetical protein